MGQFYKIVDTNSSQYIVKNITFHGNTIKYEGVLNLSHPNGYVFPNVYFLKHIKSIEEITEEEVDKLRPKKEISVQGYIVYINSSGGLGFKDATGSYNFSKEDSAHFINYLQKHVFGPKMFFCNYEVSVYQIRFGCQLLDIPDMKKILEFAKENGII